MYMYETKTLLQNTCIDLEPDGKSTLSFVGFHSKAAVACYYSADSSHNRSPTRSPSPLIYKQLSSSGDLPEISPHDVTLSGVLYTLEYR